MKESKKLDRVLRINLRLDLSNSFGRNIGDVRFNVYDAIMHNPAGDLVETTIMDKLVMSSRFDKLDTDKEGT